MSKKTIRLTESDIERIVKKVMTEDYYSKNLDLKIKKLDWNNTSNEIVVSSGGKNFAYKINYKERFGSADGSDKYKVNFKDISQNGSDLIIHRWVEGGKTEPIKIPFDDLKILSTGQQLIQDTGLGQVFVIPTSKW